MALVKPSGGFESCIRLMSIEELLKYHKESIENLVDDSGCRADEIEGLLEFAWKQGYEFRIQEEELNKGASF